MIASVTIGMIKLWSNESVVTNEPYEVRKRSENMIVIQYICMCGIINLEPFVKTAW